MSKITIDKMLTMQNNLQEKWGGIYPERGREVLLWMIGEAGEVADIIKKNGDEKILDDKNIRQHFIEEMCDVLMYFNDIMLCYNITEKELEEIYISKHNKNMNRW